MKEQNNIERLVQQHFAEEPNYPFDEAAWDELNRRLDGEKRRRTLPFWWLIPIGLVLLGLSGSLFFTKHHLNEANARISDLESALATVSDGRTDTVYRIREVVKPETIFIKKISYLPAPQSLTENFSATAKPPDTLSLDARSLSPALSEARPDILKKKEHESSMATLPKKMFRPDYRSLPTIFIVPLPTPPLAEKSDTPKKWEIGLIGQAGQLDSRMDTFGLVSKRSYSTWGLALAYRPGKHLRIALAAGREEATFQANQTRGDYFNTEVPEGYYLAEHTIRQKARFYQAGLSILPIRHRIWQPHIDLSLRANSQASAEADYRFLTTNPYSPPEETDHKALRVDALQINYLQLGLGLGIQLNRRLGLDLSIGYPVRLNTQDYLKLQWHGTGGVFFCF